MRRAPLKVSLERWRSLDASVVLLSLAQHAKRDASFIPISSRESSRWHVVVDGRDYELLLTGPKFFDTRAKVGGGGAVDLVMHVARLDFAGAVARLRAISL